MDDKTVYISDPKNLPENIFQLINQVAEYRTNNNYNKSVALLCINNKRADKKSGNQDPEQYYQAKYHHATLSEKPI